MEVQFLQDCNKLSPSMEDYHSNVDTSRPFRSVKEAVAIFGERFLAREIHYPANFTFSKQETPYYSPSSFMAHSISSEKTSIDSDDQALSEALKKIEAELEETKIELKLLKERESETEVALASLNAEVHKNMSKLAMDETDAGGKIVAMTSIKSNKFGEIEEEEEVDEDKLRNLVKTTSSLAQILSIGEEEDLYVETKKRKGKKKPIIPLFGALFSKKKGSSTTMNNPLFSHSLN